MKTHLSLLLAALVTASSAFGAPPINDICPVKKKAIRLIFRTHTKDGVVAFCCEECKDAFEKAPGKYTVAKKKE